MDLEGPRDEFQLGGAVDDESLREEQELLGEQCVHGGVAVQW